jgi:hypothetical protein
MKINNVKSYLLSNALHLQFFIAVVGLVKKFAQNLRKITAQSEALEACVDNEDLYYKIIRKSNISIVKEEGDKARDKMIVGIKSAIKTALFHFDDKIREAATRIKIVFDAYNSPQPLTKLHYDAETVAVNNLLQELDGKYAADVQITGLSQWIEELRVRNKAFEELAKEYNEEQAEKPSIRPKEARNNTDKAYNDIVAAVNGLLIIDGETDYVNFVTELNTLIKHYNDIIAQHRGRIKSEKLRTESEELENC